MAQRKRKRSRKKKRNKAGHKARSDTRPSERFLLALGSVLVVLAAAELGMRWFGGDPSESLALLDPRFGYPAEYDPLLGYVPRVGDHGRDSVWETQVSVTPSGVRGNGGSPRRGGRYLRSAIPSPGAAG